jgi:Protein of unknown function (DUF3592)
MKMINVVLLAIFFVIMSCLAGFSLKGLLLQHCAESYPHVQGTVLSSQVTITTGSKGRVYYHPNITYRYIVGDLEYTGTRYRYGRGPADATSAYAIVNSHPSGSAVNVFYAPNDPANSLLSTPVNAQDVCAPFLMVAFCSFLLWLVLRTVRLSDMPWNRAKEAGGGEIITAMMVSRLRLPRYQPFAVAVLATIILSLAAAAAIALGLPPSTPWVAGECLFPVVVIGGAAVYIWQHLNIHSGKQDLVIDESSRTIQLPLTYGRREQTPVSFSQIRTVLTDEVMHRSKGGVYYTYMVTLRMTDNSEQKLIELGLARAKSLTEWLKEKFGAPERTTEVAKTWA